MVILLGSNLSQVPLYLILIKNKIILSADIVYIFASASGNEVMESGFIERNDVLRVPRLVEDVGARENLQSGSRTRGSKATPSLQRLDKVGCSGLVDTPGLLDSLHFAPDERTVRHLENGKVEVEVKAAGINFKDVMMAMGQIQANDLGCECSGIVSAVAGDVVIDLHGLRVGDRVMRLSSGLFCTRLRLDARLAARIPDFMSFETAAALPLMKQYRAPTQRRDHLDPRRHRWVGSGLRRNEPAACRGHPCHRGQREEKKVSSWIDLGWRKNASYNPRYELRLSSEIGFQRRWRASFLSLSCWLLSLLLF